MSYPNSFLGSSSKATGLLKERFPFNIVFEVFPSKTFNPSSEEPVQIRCLKSSIILNTAAELSPWNESK